MNIRINHMFSQFDRIHLTSPHLSENQAQENINQYMRDVAEQHNMEFVDPMKPSSIFPYLDYQQFVDLLHQESIFTSTILFTFQNENTYPNTVRFSGSPYIVSGLSNEQHVVFHTYQYWLRFLIASNRHNDFWSEYNNLKINNDLGYDLYKFKMYSHPDFEYNTVHEFAIEWSNSEDFLYQLTDEEILPNYEYIQELQNIGFSSKVYCNPFYLILDRLCIREPGMYSSSYMNQPLLKTDNGKLMLRDNNLLPGMNIDWDEFLNNHYDNEQNNNSNNTSNQSDLSSDTSNDTDNTFITVENSRLHPTRNPVVQAIREYQNREANPNYDADVDIEYNQSSTDDELDSMG
jgi:hypothetical protein